MTARCEECEKTWDTTDANTVPKSHLLFHDDHFHFVIEETGARFRVQDIPNSFDRELQPAPQQEN